MTFAITKFNPYKVTVSSAQYKQGLQAVEFTITRGTSDTALDLGNTSGTFWTAAGASGLGALALKSWTQINNNIDKIVAINLIGDNGFLSRGVPTLSSTATVKWAGGSAGTALNADSADQTFTYTIVGNQVTLNVPAYNAAAKGASPGAVIVLKSTTLLPAAIRPAVDVVVRTRAYNNGAYAAGSGVAVIKTTGQVELYLDGTETTNYTVTAAAGVDNFVVTYPIAYAPNDNYSLSNYGTFPVVQPNITLNSGASPATLEILMLLTLNDSVEIVDYVGY